MAEHATDGIDILDPTMRTAKLVSPAPRPRSLAGKTLGLLDNSKEKADVFLTALAERLGQRFALPNLIQRRKPTYSRVAPPALLAELAQTCDGVITAMGA